MTTMAAEKFEIERVYATIFSFVYDGGEVLEWGHAVKDGDLFSNGKRVGRVLSIEFPPASSPWITYLRYTGQR